MDRIEPATTSIVVDEGLDHASHKQTFRKCVPVSNSAYSTKRVRDQGSLHRHADLNNNNERTTVQTLLVPSESLITALQPSQPCDCPLPIEIDFSEDHKNPLEAGPALDSYRSSARSSLGASSQSHLINTTRSPISKSIETLNMDLSLPTSSISVMEKSTTAPFPDGGASPPSTRVPTFGYSHEAGTSSSIAKSGFSNTEKQSVSSPVIETQEPKRSLMRDVLLITILCAGQFLALASLAQTIAPQNIIGDSLNATSPGMLVWFTAAYSMVYATFIMPSGRLGDMWGSKKVVLLGYVVFSITSLFAGFARSEILFCVARGLQGIGPALIVPNSIAIIARTWPMGDKRSLVISINGACGPTGFVTGALFSSIFSSYAHWPWAFWATAITCSVLSFLVYCLIDEEMAKPATPPGVAPPKFDWLGCVTGVSGLILINFALNQAPLVGWHTHYVYLLLLAGILIFGFFIYVEFNLTEYPLVPVRGLQPQAFMTLGCIAAGWASHGIWLYYFFVFTLNIRKHSPLLAVAELSPVVPCGIMFALSTGYLLKKIHVSQLMLLALLCFSVGIVFLMTAPPGQTYWGLTFLSTIVTPAGMNWSFPAGVILLSSAMPREHQGKAASLVSTVVNYAIASGLGIAGSVERAVNHDDLNILEGYRGAWYTGCSFAILGVFISLYFVWQSRRASLPK